MKGRARRRRLAHGRRRARVGDATRALALVALALGAAAGGQIAPVRAADEDPDGVGRGAAAPLVEQPRAFGHVLGDVLSQRVRLADARGELELAGMPPPGRLDDWLERLPPRSVSDRRGRRWLALDYQLINSPEAPRVIELPALALIGTDARELRVAAWPVAVGPLAPAAVPGTGELLAMRPDRLPPPPDTAALAARARLVGLALATTLVAWLGGWWWRRRRDAVRLPFARAWADIRASGGGAAGGARDDDPRAWEALHAALNAAGGRVSGAAAVDDLIGRHPWLAPSRARLEAFFAASAARFFEQPTRPVPFALGAFARELYRAERRHAR